MRHGVGILLDRTAGGHGKLAQVRQNGQATRGITPVACCIQPICSIELPLLTSSCWHVPTCSDIALPRLLVIISRSLSSFHPRIPSKPEQIAKHQHSSYEDPQFHWKGQTQYSQTRSEHYHCNDDDYHLGPCVWTNV